MLTQPYTGHNIHGQKFLGIPTYLGNPIPQLPDLLDLYWEPAEKMEYHTLCKFHHIRSAINAMILCYFNASQPITLQVNASKRAPNATPLQNNESFTHASKVISTKECRYTLRKSCKLLGSDVNTFIHTCITTTLPLNLIKSSSSRSSKRISLMYHCTYSQ